MKLRFDPQTDWDYSNAGYALLGAIVEIATKMPMQQYIRENVLKPLELTKTGWFGEKLRNVEFSHGYFGRWDKGSPPKWKLTWALAGSGGMFSTVEDLYEFYHVAFDGDFFEEESKKHLLSPLFKRWTAGWDTRTVNNRKIIEKGGSGNYGYTSLLRGYPESGVVIVVMFNSFHREAKHNTHNFVVDQLEEIVF